ncbi:MAG: carboxylesterase family protein [Deltaproteobacteria bacterium]|jgi:para-nitrobenzyl esterase|nr:carboxylesterase family protein [Deltaproteobacteria bacterium]
MKIGQFLVSLFLSLFLAVTLCPFLLAASPKETPRPVTKVSGGLVKGVKEGDLYVYRGLPYAKPPVGDLRFAPPEDAEPWASELDGSQFGYQCYQYPGLGVKDYFSEDCLTLNVWTPAKPQDNSKLPVYVFIHGGGFSSGAGSLPLYDPTSFAKNGVVAVTINYRLGALGFYASRETLRVYGTTGNWGILDQIKALEWVRDNIAAFGGDPTKVTIGGESAGSFSVSALTLSPLAKGLFRGAIMESGSILSLPELSYYARADLEKSITVSKVISDIFEVEDNPNGLKRLREADPETMVNLVYFTLDQSAAPIFLTPVFDGHVLPKSRDAAVSFRDYSPVKVLLGFNNDESTLFIPRDTPDGVRKAMLARVFSEPKAQKFLERFKVDAQNPLSQRTFQGVTYGVFSAGMKRFADLAASLGSDVYLYKFKFASPAVEKLGLGATHASELPYVFNLPAIVMMGGPGAANVAKEANERWINFIKTGDPNQGLKAPSGLIWPKYNSKDANVLYLGELPLH